ncbi:Regulator of G-protein signaling 7, variant 2 [Balamuthia mandrillaris]
MDKCSSGFPPTSPRAPSRTAKAGATAQLKAQQRKNSTGTFDDDVRTVIAAMNSPKNGIPLRKKRRGIKVYKSVFSGSEAVNWVRQNLGWPERETSQYLMKTLMEIGYLENIDKEPVFYDNDKSYYRMAPIYMMQSTINEHLEHATMRVKAHLDKLRDLVSETGGPKVFTLLTTWEHTHSANKPELDAELLKELDLARPSSPSPSPPSPSSSLSLLSSSLPSPSTTTQLSPRSAKLTPVKSMQDMTAHKQNLSDSNNKEESRTQSMSSAIPPLRVEEALAVQEKSGSVGAGSKWHKAPSARARDSSVSMLLSAHGRNTARHGSHRLSSTMMAQVLLNESSEEATSPPSSSDASLDITSEDSSLSSPTSSSTSTPAPDSPSSTNHKDSPSPGSSGGRGNRFISPRKPSSLSAGDISSVEEQHKAAISALLASSPAPASATTFHQARVVHDYTAEEDDEVSLKKGDIIEVHFMHESGWWTGLTSEGFGLFPNGFVKLLSEEEQQEEKESLEEEVEEDEENDKERLIASIRMLIQQKWTTTKTTQDQEQLRDYAEQLTTATEKLLDLLSSSSSSSARPKG